MDAVHRHVDGVVRVPGDDQISFTACQYLLVFFQWSIGQDAARLAVETAGESLKDLRVAEVTKLDVTIENGKVTSFRTRLNVSFKYAK